MEARRSPNLQDSPSAPIARSNLGGFGRVNYTRSQDSPFEVMDLLSAMERDQPFERNFIGTSIPTPIVDDNAISFETQIKLFQAIRQSSAYVLTVQTDNDRLSFEQQRRLGNCASEYFWLGHFGYRSPRR